MPRVSTRAKVVQGRVRTVMVTQRGNTVTLSCGCVATGFPAVSNPDRWWCREHHGWQRAKKVNA